MTNISQTRTRDDVILMDGGMGQELLHRSGLEPHPLWSTHVMIEQPGAVRDLHADYIRAGARVIITNTYSTTRRRLAEAGIEERFAELNELAARLAAEARDAVGEEVRIAGALSPLYGSYRPERARSFEDEMPIYAEHAELLAPHVDLFVCETMSTAEEGRAAAVAAAATGKEVWVAWTLEDEGAKTLRSGETLRAACDALEGIPVAALLVNCCWPESISAAMADLVALSDRPAGGYANGFTAIPEGWMIEDGIEVLGSRRELGPDRYAAFVQDWIDHGARIVGGCCEIGPAHIARIDTMLRAA